MPHREHNAIILAMLLAGAGAPALSAPPFELADDGRTFVYRARPGEAPARVAESFGVPGEGMAAFLASNGIADATRVPLGFEYRIPNPLGPRLEALAGEIERLERALAARTARAAELEDALERAQAQAVLTDEKERRLVALETRWPLVIDALVVALLGLAGASWMAYRSARRLTGVARHARALAQELEARRGADLAERQEAGRRINELETRLRQLERSAPRLVTAGRS